MEDESHSRLRYQRGTEIRYQDMSVSALEKSASAFPADFLKSPPSEGRNAQIITTIDLPISWMELGLTPENLSECCLLQMTDVLHVSSPQLEEIRIQCS